MAKILLVARSESSWWLVLALVPKFWEGGRDKCHLTFCECRWGDGSTQRWWEHLNLTTAIKLISAFALEVVGTKKPSLDCICKGAKAQKLVQGCKGWYKGSLKIERIPTVQASKRPVFAAIFTAIRGSQRATW